MAYFTDKFNGIDYFNNIHFHHLEFYVGNAKQAKEYYKKVFGFSDYAYSGPETGVQDKVSYVIKKNKVIYVLTTPLLSNHPISNWLCKHGDGIYDIAGNEASTSQSNNTATMTDGFPPTISSLSLAANNSTIAVTMSEAVFSTNGGS